MPMLESLMYEATKHRNSVLLAHYMMVIITLVLHIVTRFANAVGELGANKPLMGDRSDALSLLSARSNTCL